jgi:hypothetical protein
MLLTYLEVRFLLNDAKVGYEGEYGGQMAVWDRCMCTDMTRLSRQMR